MKVPYFDNRFKEGETRVVISGDPGGEVLRLVKDIKGSLLISVEGLSGEFRPDQVMRFTNMPLKGGRPRIRKFAIRSDRALSTLHEFDKLPDVSVVGSTVVAALLDCSKVTVWRLAKHKKIPKPLDLGSRKKWNVGELRTFLRSNSQ